MKKMVLFVLVIVVFGCSDYDDPQVLIDKAISVSGVNNLNRAAVSFTFRGKRYNAKFNDGLFQYSRQFEDSSRQYKDVITNDGFYRTVNGEKSHIPDSMAMKYYNSVNSVIYFALLPKGLNDDAVIKEYLGETKIAANSYHKVKITFTEEGGGEDFQDEFIYWINQNNYKIDFLAYKFFTDGGGMRFREAYNERYIEGVRIVDYINYKPQAGVLLENIDKAFVEGDLKEVSRIELKNVTVNHEYMNSKLLNFIE